MKGPAMKLFFSLMLGFFLLTISSSNALDANESADSNNEQPASLEILTGPAGGDWFNLGTALAEIWSANIIPSAATVGGGMSNLAAINDGKGDVGLTVAALHAASIHTKHLPQTNNLTILARLYPEINYFIVQRDFAEEHNLSTVGELLERKIPVRLGTLQQGSSSEFLLKILLNDGYGYSYEQLVNEQGWSFKHLTYEAATDLFLEKEIDVLTFSASPKAPNVKAIEAATPISLLGMDKKALDILTETYATTTFTLPRRAHQSLSDSIDVVGDYTILISRKNLPEQLAFDLSQLLWENKGLLVEALPAFKALTPQTALPTNSETVNPGALKFWQSLK